MPPSSRTWTWGDEYNRYEVILGDEALMWVWTGPKDFGAAGEQPIAEFLAFGPNDSSIPATMLAELRSTIANGDRYRSFSDEAEALLAARARQAQRSEEARREAIERSRAARALPDPWLPVPGPPGHWPRSSPLGPRAPHEPSAAAPSSSQSRPGTPAVEPRSIDVPGAIGPLLAYGLVVFVVGISLPMALANVMPLSANYLGLFLPVLFGFFAAFRWKYVALIVAGFFAMAGAIVNQINYDRYMELAQGSVVTLHSIASAPLHPEATRFVVDDVRGVRALTGSSSRRVYQTTGSGPSYRLVYYAMPLVPTGWDRSEAVPAWLVCNTSPGYDCLKASVKGIAGTARVHDYDRQYYLPAIADAERTQHLVSAPGAPVLEAIEDPAGAPARYRAASVWGALAVYGLWALLVVLWRGWKSRTNSSAH